MCITGHSTDGKQHSQPVEKHKALPQPANTVSHSSIIPASYTQYHSAYCYYERILFLSIIEKIGRGAFMKSYIEIEVYDNEADGQDDEGRWPTKLIHVSKPWLDEYAKSATRYSSADQLLVNYTYDELECFEEKARDAGALA